jgi:8-amino-7-oxononanoate synthase
MESLDRFAREKSARLEEARQKRTFAVTTRGAGARATRAGRELVSFSCNDYLGLSTHPGVVRAAAEATERYGAGAGGSRLVTGNHPLIAALEERVARFKETEAALVFGSGYLTNAGVIPALIGPGDLVAIDERAHACLFAGAQLSRATVATFAHNDVGAAAKILREQRAGHQRAMLLTEGVFSMDGDRAPLAELSALSAGTDTWLLVDDAHGVGVLADGRGSVAASAAGVPLQVGTFSKAFGSYGGYLAASHEVVDLLRSRARTQVYSTGLPPAAAAASLAALELIESSPELCRRPLENARRFSRALGLAEPTSAIVPLVLGSEDRALKAMRDLEEDGFLAVAIRPPTVAPGTARVRFTFSAAHTDDDVDALAAAVKQRGLA